MYNFDIQNVRDDKKTEDNIYKVEYTCITLATRYVIERAYALETSGPGFK